MRPLAYFPSHDAPSTEGWIVLAVPVSLSPSMAEQDAFAGGGSRIEDVIARHEKNPKRRAAIERARSRLGRQVAAIENGDSLTSFRLRKGFSQAQLAELIGTQQPYIARLENGGVPKLSAPMIRKLRDALGVTADQIVDALPGAAEEEGKEA